MSKFWNIFTRKKPIEQVIYIRRYPRNVSPASQKLTDEQLEIMRNKYCGFAYQESTQLKAKSDERRYKERVGYVPERTL